MKTQAISAFVPKVRKVLDVTERDYADADIAQCVVDGIMRMRSARPASQYVGMRTEGFAPPSAAVELLAYQVTYDERWELGIVYYAAARCYEMSITDSVSLQLAQTLKQQADAVFAS